MSSVFVLCNLLQKWVCYACPKFWKFLPECTVFFQELSNKKKKIKALRPKMTKIASRGGGSCLKQQSLPGGSSSGSSSTDLVLPVYKRSSPPHPLVVCTACETPNLWKSLCAPPLPICLPSCLLAQSFGTLFLPLLHLALHCLHLPLLLTHFLWTTGFLLASHFNYS